MKFKQISSLDKDKKGQMEVPISIAVSIIALVIILAIGMFVLAKINLPSLFTASSLEANASTDFVRNYTVGTSTVGGFIPTFFVIAAVVAVLLIVVLIFVAIRRFREGAEGTGGGGFG